MIEYDDLPRSIGHVTQTAEDVMTSEYIGADNVIHCSEQLDCVTAAEQLLHGHYYYYY